MYMQRLATCMMNFRSKWLTPSESDSPPATIHVGVAPENSERQMKKNH